MKLTPLDIRKQEFKRVMKGYEKHEVDIFLEMIAKEMEDLLRENHTMEEQIKELDAKIEDYRRMEKTLQDTLLSAQKTTDELRKNAEKEAELIIRNSQVQAEELINNARKEIQELQRQISALKTQKETFIAQMKGFLQSQLRMLHEIEIPESELEGKGTKKKTQQEGYKSIGDLFYEKP